MNTRFLTASILSLGLLAGGASLAQASSNEFCANGSFDNQTLTCKVDQNGYGSVTENAGIAVAQDVNNSAIGDFVNESTADRSARTSR